MDDLCRALDDMAFPRLDGDDLARRAAIARKLEPVTPAVLAEVVNLLGDRSIERLADSANAVTLAEDFDRRASRGH